MELTREVASSYLHLRNIIETLVRWVCWRDKSGSSRPASQPCRVPGRIVRVQGRIGVKQKWC